MSNERLIHRKTFSRPVHYEDALVTSLVPYGESDCIVRLLFKNQGRRVAFFKRGLSSSKTKPGTIQAPCFAMIGYIDTHQDDKLIQLTSCDIDPASFLNVSSLRRLGFNCYIAELIERFLPEHEPALHIFGHAQESFVAIAAQGAESYLLRAFELKLLDFCGYLPELEPLAGPITAYDPIACQFLDTSPPDSLSFCNAALALAQNLLTKPVGQVRCHDLDLLKKVGNIFLGRLRMLGGAPLQSIAFLKQISRKMG